jgi:hypothetical protein
MSLKIINIVYSKSFFTEVESMTFYISPSRINLQDGFLVNIGVQMALPFQKDKKSGVMKFNWRNCIPKKSSSRKSVVNSVKTTTLQLGARGETIE